MSSKPKIIVILGPTASGKTDLSIKIAKKFDGEIVSADSRQVYKGMDIGTGKITEKEKRGIPHYLLDVASPKKRFNIWQYQKLANKAIKKILAKNKIPIIVGGTGFYINSITDNLEFPKVKPDWKLRKKLEKQSIESLFKKLKRLDPKRAKLIDDKNPRRIIRALEIIIKTKKPVPELNKGSSDFDFLFLGIKKKKEELKKLILKRLLKRLELGMIKEVENLKKSGVSWKTLDDFGLEYRYIARYLQKKISREEIIFSLQKEIEHYAKRQMTWFRKDKRINWIKDEKMAIRLIKKYFS